MLEAKALVAGSPPAAMDKPIRIRVVRQFYYKGKLQEVGTELDYPYGLALETIHVGKALRVVEKSEAAAKVESETEPAPKSQAKKGKE